MVSKNKRRILFLIIILVTVFIGCFVFKVFRPVKSVRFIESEYSITAIELFNEYSISEEASNKKYLGKVIQVTGTISEINTKDSACISVILKTEDPFSGINCVISDKYFQLQNGIFIGSEVVVKGECSGKLIDVVLNNCVIVND